MAIASSFYDNYRETPIIKVVKDQKVPDGKCFEYETKLHKYFRDYKYNPVVAFSGSTELFDLYDVRNDVVQAYEAVLAGLDPDADYIRPEDVLPF